MKRVSSRKSAAVLALALVCLAICTAIASSPSHPQTTTETRSKQESGARRITLSLVDPLVDLRESRDPSGEAAVTEEKNFTGSQKKPLEAKAARQVVPMVERSGVNRVVVRLDGPDCTNALGNALGTQQTTGTQPAERYMVIGQSASVIPHSLFEGDSLQDVSVLEEGPQQVSIDVGTVTPQPGSSEWVDLAIPSKYFDSVVAPQGEQRTGAQRTGTEKYSGSSVQQRTGERTGTEKYSGSSVQGSSVQGSSVQGSSVQGSVQGQRSIREQYSGTEKYENYSGTELYTGAGQHAGTGHKGNFGGDGELSLPDRLRNAGVSVEGGGSSSDPETSYTPGHAIPDWILRQGSPLNQTVLESLPSQTPTLGTTESPKGGDPSSLLGAGMERHSLDQTRSTGEISQEKQSHPHHPVLIPGEHHPARIDALARRTDYFESDFSPQGGPQGSTFDPMAALSIYRGKFQVPVQRPLIELWRPLYTSGIYPPALTWFGATNPMKPHFMVYGDMRTAVGANQNQAGKSNVWGNVLNLDMDLQLTSTERIHALVTPLNRGTQATGLSFNDEVDFLDATNFNFLTLFFEGDLGALVGGASNRYPPFDLPFTFGLIPLVYQNGIWANDAVLGAAVALPARHNRHLKWSNFDATLFWATDNITTDAFPGQDSAADFFGTAWFIDAYEGYIEADYAFVNDNTGAGRGYHNIAMAFTRRYFSRVSNSIRLIVNTGQERLPKTDRTADGHLLLIENSLITAYPNTVVPYLNLFYGQGRPQSLARVGQAGGILNNTGINFETDGITGYPTLDATGHNTLGFAAGVNLLGSQFSHQLVLETAMLKATGPASLRNAEGDQYAVGLRYQKPLSHNLIFRTDHMAGFRESASNLNGSRFELRWKF